MMAADGDTPMMYALLAVLATLQAAPAVNPMRAAVEQLTTTASNEARFEAMTALLGARKIPFTVERFSIEKAIGREPRTEGRNIVATFGSGGNPIVVGAHYDATRLQDGTLSRGAIDNAGSSVILTQIAESLMAQPPAGRVTLVWFDMEELGLIGSQKYVEAHAGDRISAMVNLDVNGYGDTLLFGSSRGAANAAARKAVLETCAALDASCVGLVQMPPGDDRSFVKAGIPAVSLAILPAVEAHQLWLMMSGPDSGLAQGKVPAIMTTLHTPADTIDKIDAAAMARQADFVIALVRRLDGRR
jgi:Zn-dependent M28 family amino/carboxypeptidase